MLRDGSMRGTRLKGLIPRISRSVVFKPDLYLHELLLMETETRAQIEHFRIESSTDLSDGRYSSACYAKHSASHARALAICSGLTKIGYLSR